MSDFLLVLVNEFNRAGTAALLQGFLIALQDLILGLSLAVASSLGLFLHAVDAALDGFQVAQLQLQVDNLLVAHGIDGAVNVGHVVIVKAAQHVNDGIGLADVTQELVTQAFASARALDQSCDINNLNRSGHNARRVHQFGELIEALIGYRNHSHVGFDGAEREVGRLRLGIRQTVKQSGFTHIGQAHDSAL